MNRNIKKSILVFALMIMTTVSVFAAPTGISAANTLRDGLNNGGDFYLKNDITLEQSLAGATGRTVTIDLKGKTLTVPTKYYIEIGPASATKATQGSKVTIKDSVGGGKIIATGLTDSQNDGNSTTAKGSLFCVNKFSTLTLDNVTVEVTMAKSGANAAKCQVIRGYGTVNINGKTSVTSKSTGILVLDSRSGCTCTVSGTSSLTGDVGVNGTGILTLDGGSIKGKVSALGTLNKDGTIKENPTITIKKGSITGDVSNTYGYMTMTGGSITGNVDLKWTNKASITGGTVNGNVSVSGLLQVTNYSGSQNVDNLVLGAATINGDLNVSHTTVTVKDGANAKITGNVTASSDGILTINDCQIDGNVTAAGSGVVRLYNGTEIKGNLSSTGSSDINCFEVKVGKDITTSSDGKLTIYSGTYGGDINEGKTDSIKISGGTFADDPSEQLAPGIYSYNDADGKYSVIDWKPAAVVASTPYKTLAAAVTAAKEGDTILIASDVTGDVTINKNITLDLNGKTLDGDISVATGTSLSVIDSDKDGKGLADGLLSAAASGNLEIESGKFSTDPSDYLADGKFAKYDREDRIYVVTTPNNSASLNLEGNIGINLIIDTESYTDDGEAYVHIVYDRLITIKGEDLPDEEYIYLKNGYNKDNLNRAKFTVSMGPVQLINKVSLYFYNADNELLYSKENYTATEFCRYVVDNAASFDASFVDLCTTLLNYGSMTQAYFNAQTDSLPNAGLGIADAVASVDTSEWSDYYGEFSKDLPQYVGTSLICSSDMVVRHYFKDPIDGYEIELSSKPDGSGMAITTGYNTTGYYVEVYGIESPYLDSNYTITLTDTETGDIHTITYSPMCYARKTVSRSTSKASLVNLCKSIYLYGSAAQEYFIGE